MSSTNSLKIVDVSQIDAATGDELFEAAATQGFLFVEGHGFTQTEVDQIFDLSRKFFELPEDKKMELPVKDNHGYVKCGGENLDPDSSKNGDPKEALNFSQLNLLTGEAARKFPSWFYEDQERAQTVQSTIVKLADLNRRVLQLLAIGLKIESQDNLDGSEWFNSKYAPEEPSGTTFRFLHYPGQKSVNPEAVIRAGAHTDYGSVTFLFQQENQEGLEVYIDKKWQQVPFVAPSTKFPGESPPIIINIADLLSYWTAGLLKSTIHRVKFPAKIQETGQDRYSIVFFSHPNDNTLLAPVPSEKTKNIKNRGANNADTLITARQYLDKRLAATYDWTK